eukprot:Anaeramoba_flamelloidesa568007_428.p2 GENE.a568007_428~~a568007_428.p2  ORF type:complete len:285 (-),score=72.58 a568007_428:3006-3860(-)
MSALDRLKKDIESQTNGKPQIKGLVKGLKEIQALKDLESIVKFAQKVLDKPSLTESDLLNPSGVQLINFINVVSPTPQVQVIRTPLIQVQQSNNLNMYQKVLTEVFRYPKESVFSIPSLIEKSPIAQRQLVQSLVWIKLQIETFGTERDDFIQKRTITLLTSGLFDQLVLGKPIDKEVFQNSYYQGKEGLFKNPKLELKTTSRQQNGLSDSYDSSESDSSEGSEFNTTGKLKNSEVISEEKLKSKEEFLNNKEMEIQKQKRRFEKKIQKKKKTKKLSRKKIKCN